MMDAGDVAKLDDYEDEDIFDVIEKLAKSFQIRFDKYTFQDVNNFGEFCDTIENSIHCSHQESCTKQQAFYKIRKAILSIQSVDKTQIRPGTKLVELFPKRYRRKQVKKFQKELNVKFRFLTYPDWLALLFVAGFLLSFLIFFLDWKIAVSAIIIFSSALTIADYFGRELQCETIRHLTEIAVRENYIDMRRKLTVNKKEIPDVIKEVFSEHLSVSKEYLTRDTRFSWTIMQ